jgi:hypothetical protein
VGIVTDFAISARKQKIPDKPRGLQQAQETSFLPLTGSPGLREIVNHLI